MLGSFISVALSKFTPWLASSPHVHLEVGVKKMCAWSQLPVGKDTWDRYSHDLRVAHCENLTWKKISPALISSVVSFVCLLSAGGVFFCSLFNLMPCILQRPNFKQWKLSLYLDKSTQMSCLHEMFAKQRGCGEKKPSASFFFLLLMPTVSGNL